MGTAMKCFILVLAAAAGVAGQQGEWEGSAGAGAAEEGRDVVTWCTVSRPQQHKCANLSRAIIADRALFGEHYIELRCEQALDNEECMGRVDAGAASLLSLDAGEVFLAGRYHSLVPILQEVYPGEVAYEYSVAVTRRGALEGVRAGEGLRGLRGARACFPSVGALAGWTLPVYTLMQEGGLQVTDCNNHVKSASEYFGESCASNALSNTFNPIGDNSDKLCRLCAGGAGQRCTGSDPYAGYAGALRCLLERRADVAFLRHASLASVPEEVELVCKDGSRAPPAAWPRCHWGRTPADAIVTSSSRSLLQRQRYQQFFLKMVRLYGEPNRANASIAFPDSSSTDQYGNLVPRHQNTFRDEHGNLFTSTDRYQFQRNAASAARNPTPGGYQSATDLSGKRIETFRLFESRLYGAEDLLLQDAAVGVRALAEEQQAAHQLLQGAENERAQAAVLGVRACPVRRARLCVTSEPEFNKCVKMRTALKSAFLAPELACHRGLSARLCERAVAEGLADLVLLDAADMMHAAQHHRLVPFMREVYSGGHSWYYAVAVAKEQDPDTDITYLRGKNTCHAGISTAAGWIYPLAYLISNRWIRDYGCDGARAASEYFSKSCAPGALSTEYVDPAQGAPRENLCHLCHGTSFRRCRRDASEDYYGHVGALRCMVEGGGDVAFVRHTAPYEVSGGRRTEWWARDLLLDDLQLLCPDGTRAKVTEYAHCNLGRVPGSVLVGRANHTELDAYSNLLLYAQQFYGADTADDLSFSMFSSPPPYSDLLFSSAALALRPLRRAERSAARLAGPALPRAARIVACDAPHVAALQADPGFLSAASARAAHAFCVCVAALALLLRY